MMKRGRYWQVFNVVLVFQVLSGFLYSGQSYWLMYSRVPWWTMALYYSGVNLFWAAVSPLIVWLSYRLPIEKSHWVRNPAIHVLAASGLSFAALAYQAVIDRI